MTRAIATLQALAPTVNGGRKSDGVWRNALRVASERTIAEHMACVAEDETRHESVTVLTRAALALVHNAIGGDMAALKELGDRLDGRASPQEDETKIGTQINVQIVRYGDNDGQQNQRDAAKFMDATTVSDAVVEVSGARRETSD